MGRLIRHIVDAAIHNGVIEKNDRDLYEYAYSALLEQAITWLTILLISICFHVVMEAAVYAVVFIPMRIYGGGYHARTFWGCYFLSVIVWGVAVILLAQVVIGPTLYWGILIASTGVIVFLSPMADPNKPIDNTDRIRYTQIMRILLCIDTVIAIVLRALVCTRASTFALFAFIHLALLLLVGRLIFRKYKKV